MQSNKQSIEQEIYANYEDAVFRLAVHKAAEQEGKRLMEEAHLTDDDFEYTPTAESRDRFLKLLDYELKRTVMKEHRLKRIHLKRLTVVLAAVIALISISLMTVDAFRVKVFNFVLGINEKYTSMQMQDNGGNEAVSKMIVDWKNAYVPTYIPDGYEVSDVFNTEDLKSITFKNKSDANMDIIFTETASVSNLEIDTEDASSFSTIMINGNKGILTTKNNVVAVAWVVDKRILTINGQVDKKTIILIAESAKYNN